MDCAGRLALKARPIFPQPLPTTVEAAEGRPIRDPEAPAKRRRHLPSSARTDPGSLPSPTMGAAHLAPFPASPPDRCAPPPPRTDASSRRRSRRRRGTARRLGLGPPDLTLYRGVAFDSASLRAALLRRSSARSRPSDSSVSSMQDGPFSAAPRQICWHKRRPGTGRAPPRLGRHFL